MLKEMKLYLVLLVLNWYLPPSITFPTSNSELKQSRYIINNRRNFLFNKPFIKMYTKAVSITPNFLKFSNETMEKERQSRHESINQKDLKVEASVEEHYYEKYKTHSLPTMKINDLAGERIEYAIKSQLNGNQTSKVSYSSQNFIQTKKDYSFHSLETQTNPGDSRKIFDERLTWILNENPNDFVLSTSERVSISAVRTPLGLLHREKSEDEVDSSTLSFNLKFSTPQEFDLVTTTTSFPWEYDGRKPKEESFGNKQSRANEKHAFKTRIETVDYHQQTIFNPSRLESYQIPSWHQKKTYEDPRKNYEEDETIDVTYEESYEQTEKNYEEKENNYKEEDKNYEEEENNYEKEKKYKEEVEKYEEEEKNYEEEEKNYEEEEKKYEEEVEKYEEEEKNYEEEEKNYKEEKKYEEEERKYEEEERKYEEEERKYEEEERKYEEEERKYEEEERKYEEEEKNYEEEERKYEEEERKYEEQERKYEEEEKNYEEEERKYEEEEKNYEEEEKNYEEKEKIYKEKEKNYEEEKNHEKEEKSYEEKENNSGKEQIIQILNNGNPADNNNKFGYVVEEKNYRKYRVEEKTIDGFIVGEYGVVSHNDGSLRGVRYTADGKANPQLIYKALIKFLSL